MMNRTLQVANIRRLIEREGYDSDKFDVDAHVDGTLTFEENWQIIKQDLQFLAPRKMGGMATMENPFGTTSGNKINNFMEAQDFHNNRPKRKQIQDGRMNAKRMFEPSQLNDANFRKWKKKPNRYDIKGIDGGMRF